MFGRSHARLLIPLASALLVLTGCSGGDDDPSAESSASQQAPVDERPPAKAEAIESGFGQQGTKVMAVAVVKNQSPTDGQNLQVTFTLLGPAKRQIATLVRPVVFSEGEGSQAVAAPGDLTGLDTRSVKSVQVTTTVENADVDLDTPEVSVEIARLQRLRTGLGARIAATNEGDDDLASGTALSVVCRDARQRLIGGGVVQTPPIPSGKTVRVEVRDLVVSGRAAACEATPAPQ